MKLNTKRIVEYFAWCTSLAVVLQSNAGCSSEPLPTPNEFLHGVEVQWNALDCATAKWEIQVESHAKITTIVHGTLAWSRDGRYKIEEVQPGIQTQWVASDGKTFRSYKRYPPKEHQSALGVMSDAPKGHAWTLMLMNPVARCRTLYDRLLLDFQVCSPGAPVPEKPVRVGVEQVYVLRLVGWNQGFLDVDCEDATTDTINQKLTLDPKKGYMIVSREVRDWRGRTLRKDKVLDSTEIDGVFIPTSVEITEIWPRYGTSDSHTYFVRLNDIQINGDVPPEAFDMDFPAGTAVDDQRLGSR